MELRNGVNEDMSNIYLLGFADKDGICSVPKQCQKGPYTNFIFIFNDESNQLKSGMYYWDMKDLDKCKVRKKFGTDYVNVPTKCLYIL